MGGPDWSQGGLDFYSIDLTMTSPQKKMFYPRPSIYKFESYLQIQIHTAAIYLQIAFLGSI